MEIVVAAAENDVIGLGNGLPWRLPADLKHFKSLTWGHTVLMGRKTYQSIGRALPGRTNVVLSRSEDFQAEGCTLVRSVEEARGVAGGSGVLMVIGGAEIYRQCLPHVSRIHLTLVHASVEGDAFFSQWREPAWTEVSRRRYDADPGNPYDYSFITLKRRPAGPRG